MRHASRSIAFAWATAGLIAIAVVTFLIARAPLNPDFRPYFKDVDTAFIGTSLMGYAFSDLNQTGDAPFPEAGQTLRVTLAAGRETQVFRVARDAVQSGVQTVFIEVNPLVSHFRFQDPARDWINDLKQRRRVVQGEVKGWFGAKNIALGLFRIDNEVSLPISKESLAHWYPLHIRPPTLLSDWHNLIRSAPKTRFILIAMPRAQIAKDVIGPEVMERFHQSAEDAAETLGLPLFAPDRVASWPDTAFVDQAHVNKTGERRFQAELAEWLEQSR